MGTCLAGLSLGLQAMQFPDLCSGSEDSWAESPFKEVLFFSKIPK